MKGILLAGGNGTRMRPLTYITNKQLLPVYNKPMVMYPLETLKALGITEILLVSGGEHIGHFSEYLGDGEDFGVSLTYRVQRAAGGIAEALGLSKAFANGDSVTVVLGDNIFDNSLIPEFNVEEDKAYLFTKKVSNPEKFGVISMTAKGREGLPTIIEKPIDYVGNQAVVGLYIYPNDVFDIVPTLKPSARGELEITDVNNYYVLSNRAEIKELQGFWSDAGSFDSLLASSNWAKTHSSLDK